MVGGETDASTVLVKGDAIALLLYIAEDRQRSIRPGESETEGSGSIDRDEVVRDGKLERGVPGEMQVDRRHRHR